MIENTDTTEEEWHEYVEGELREAEVHIENALHACENQHMRGSLMGTYRDIVGTIFRYYDNVEFDTDLSEETQDTPEEYKQFEEWANEKGSGSGDLVSEDDLISDEQWDEMQEEIEEVHDELKEEIRNDECHTEPDKTGHYNASTVTGDSHTFSSIKDTVDELIHSSVNKEGTDE